MFKENVGIGYMVGSVASWDNDAGVNKELRYSLLPGREFLAPLVF